MNSLETLKQTWKSDSADQGTIQQRIWDRAAKSFGEAPIPTFADNLFLQRMAAELPLTGEVRTLDVGCGSGIYSLALAPRVGEAVGVDISPEMIRYAQDKKQTLGLTNTRFSCLNWDLADVDALGFRGAFDVAFAHMTPAVHDFKTLDKLNACSRNLCLVEKPVRRCDPLQDEIFRLVGLDDAQSHGDSTVEAFSYLWYKGYRPQFFYGDEVWTSDRSPEDTAAWYLDRARLQKPISLNDETRVLDFLRAQAPDGLVHERTTVTRVTILWHI